MVAAAAVAVVTTAVVVRSQVGGEPPVDRELAAKIRATGLTPYVVELEGAELVDVEVVDGAVYTYYDHGYFVNESKNSNERYGYSFTVAMSPSRPGDLCGPKGSGPRKNGGSCTSKGDWASSEFEDMGSFWHRVGDTDVTIATTVDMDDDIGVKAMAALNDARRVSVDYLARRSDPKTKRF